MKKVIFLGLMLSVLSCKAQEKATKVPLKKMEEFNGQDLNKFQVMFLGEINFTKPNGDEVRQIEDKDSYTEYISKKGTPFETVNIFYKRTCALKATGERFYGFPIGIFKEYNQNGVLIKEINSNEPYKFTLEALIQKVEKEFHINIMKNTIGVSVTRTTNPVPQYELDYPVIEGNPLWLNIVIFDGITGFIIRKTSVKGEM